MSSYNPYSLLGKTVLVTGASSGIGKATAIECSKLGAKVIITGRNKERLNETFSMLEGDGHLAVIADLTNDTDLDNLVAEIPVVDGLVNNAGIWQDSKPVNFIKRDELERAFQTNVFACIMLTKVLLKKKKINKGGSIVFTSSIASFRSTPGLGVYAATKAALASYMQTCAIELGVKGIRANAVHPGMVHTDLIHGGVYTDEDMDKDRELYILKRYGRPEEVAWSIIYLLSDAASWITGSSFVLDGGRMLK